MLVGYVRVSTADDRQNTDLQRYALQLAGVDCTPKVRQMVKVVYSERETTHYEPQVPHLYQRL